MGQQISKYYVGDGLVHGDRDPLIHDPLITDD